jgi:hypothetical protein
MWDAGKDGIYAALSGGLGDLAKGGSDLPRRLLLALWGENNLHFASWGLALGQSPCPKHFFFKHGSGVCGRLAWSCIYCRLIPYS